MRSKLKQYMSVIKKIINLFKPACERDAYKLSVEELYQKHKGPEQLHNKTRIADGDMLKLIGKLKDGVWPAKVVNNGGNDKFEIYYYGELEDEAISWLPNFPPIRIKLVNSFTKDEIELFDEAYDGCDAILNCFYEEDKLEDRPLDKKYITKNGQQQFRVLVIIYYDPNIKKEIKEKFEKNGKVLNDDELEVDYDFVMRNSFSNIIIYAIDNDGNSFEIINQETA
jgi:hypothetical protein